MNFSLILFSSLCFITLLIKESKSTNGSDVFVESSMDNRSLMDIMMAILNDPEFLSLQPHQQLKVLIIIYNMLESLLKQQYGTDQIASQKIRRRRSSEDFMKINS